MIIGAATSDRQGRTSAKKSVKLIGVRVIVAVFWWDWRHHRVGRNNQRALRRDEVETAQCAPLIAPYDPRTGMFPVGNIPVRVYTLFKLLE